MPREENLTFRRLLAGRGTDGSLQRFCYLAGDVVLNHQDVAEGAVVGFRPDDVAIVGTHQSHGDPQPRAGSRLPLAGERIFAEHPLVCGLFFGAAVEVVMGYIVLPLSALHERGPYTLQNVLLGLGVHMVVIGLPISFSVRRFAR